MKEISVEAMGFDFTLVEPNMVHIEEHKMRGLSTGDEVAIFSKRENQTYHFKIKQMFFNGFEYEQ